MTTTAQVAFLVGIVFGQISMGLFMVFRGWRPPA
jgi:hypothetical protein